MNARYDFTLDVTDLIDTEKEQQRLQKEITDLERYINSIQEKLSNTKFVNNAPVEIVEQERTKLGESQQKLVAKQQELAQI